MSLVRVLTKIGAMFRRKNLAQFVDRLDAPTRVCRVLVLTLVALVFTSGCTTMSYKKYRQAVLVRSEPPGAYLYVDGQRVGATPKLVDVRRGRQPSIEIETERERVVVPIESQYRWNDSFFSGLVFLTYAPIAWLTDLATGTSWDLKDPGVKKLDPRFRGVKKELITWAAIAPPLAETIGLSDAGGLALEERLLPQAGPRLTFRRYRDTLQTFSAHGYDYDGKPAEADLGDLYRELNSQIVYESAIRADGDAYILRAQKRNIITREVEPVLNLRFESEDRSIWSKPWFLRIFPNTIGLDFWTENLSVTRGNTRIELLPIEDGRWYSKGLTYLSAINVTSLPGLRSGRAARWQWSLVPALRFSRRMLRSSSPDPKFVIQEEQFRRWWISGGYGGEVGWQLSRHYLYFNFVPTAYWNEIVWKQAGRDHSRTGIGGTIQAELGYLYFFNENWNLRLFARTISEDAEGWNEALRRTLPPLIGVQEVNAQSSISGITIGYRFDTILGSRKWIATKD